MGATRCCGDPLTSAALELVENCLLQCVTLRIVILSHLFIFISSPTGETIEEFSHTEASPRVKQGAPLDFIRLRHTDVLDREDKIRDVHDYADHGEQEEFISLTHIDQDKHYVGDRDCEDFNGDSLEELGPKVFEREQAYSTCKHTNRNCEGLQLDASCQR